MTKCTKNQQKIVTVPKLGLGGQIRTAITMVPIFDLVFIIMRCVSLFRIHPSEMPTG